MDQHCRRIPGNARTASLHDDQIVEAPLARRESRATGWAGRAGAWLIPIGALAFMVAGASERVLAQTGAGPKTRTVKAVRIDARLKIDGVLDEPEWKQAQVTGDFVQREPQEGRPPSEPTEVRLLYNKDFLYVGAVMHDSDIKNVRISELIEDHSTSQEDAFAILVDSFHDGATADQIEVNPAGARNDIQYTGNGSIANRDWDGIWYVKTSRRSDAWVAEFAIPFKTLRFSNLAEQRWAINFRRRVARAHEEDVWSPLPRSQNFYTPSMAGTLEGLTDLRPGRSLFLKPYVLGAVSDLRTDLKVSGKKDAGFDVKYGITNGLTLDGTFRTDFAQAEVDLQQVNLTRFSLFFPEKREFFLENGGLFSFASQSSAAGGSNGISRSLGGIRRPAPFGSNDFVLFFSRRIGLSSAGTPLPIIGGVRLTGRVPGRTEIGLLNITSDAANGAPVQNFSVAKVRTAMLANSDVGVMVLDREDAGSTFNRAVGIEQNLRLRSNVFNVNTFWAKTFSPNSSGDDQAWGVSSSWRDRSKSAGLFFREIQAGFDDQLGFVRRRGIRQANASIGLFRRPSRESRFARLVREVNPQVSVDYVMSGSNQLMTRTVAPTADVQFFNGSLLTVGWEGAFDRVDRQYLIGPRVPIPRGDYNNTSFHAEYIGDETQTVAASGSFARGDFYGGTRHAVGLGTLVKVNQYLAFRSDYTRSAVDLPTRSFVSHLGSLQTAIGLAPPLTINVLLQYNSDTNQAFANVRLRYNYRPLNDFFILYNETRDVFGARDRDRTLTLKFTYSFGN